ncbi:hypothetical protein CRM22_008694 [Opisthorchis felineus]|uniref:Uncharacterized protein n=1 Tax=Opisthorchis felineus TaxID=147828 RepID=A0A4S2LAP6_OPIFE|nr:hypothetical protein CRM22_008694 [Opisthorchis felineus]TGZ60174.1 hypothetical protein CRM22_008694 [Opisthorchis felineus]
MRELVVRLYKLPECKAEPERHTTEINCNHSSYMGYEAQISWTPFSSFHIQLGKTPSPCEQSPGSVECTPEYIGSGTVPIMSQFLILAIQTEDFTEDSYPPPKCFRQ